MEKARSSSLQLFTTLRCQTDYTLDCQLTNTKLQRQKSNSTGDEDTKRNCENTEKANAHGKSTTHMAKIQGPWNKEE